MLYPIMSGIGQPRDMFTTLEMISNNETSIRNFIQVIGENFFLDVIIPPNSIPADTGITCKTPKNKYLLV